MTRHFQTSHAYVSTQTEAHAMVGSATPNIRFAPGTVRPPPFATTTTATAANNASGPPVPANQPRTHVATASPHAFPAAHSSQTTPFATNPVIRWTPPAAPIPGSTAARRTASARAHSTTVCTTQQVLRSLNSILTRTP